MRVSICVPWLICIALLAGGAAICEEEKSPQPPPNDSVAPVPSAKPSEPGKPYTSVIIDTSGFILERSMSPKILKPDGTEVWGTVKANYDELQDRGVAGYVCSLEDAKKSSRCGANPLILTAVAVQGKNSSDPVISDDDAKLLLDEDKISHFLDKYNVIFLKGSPPASDSQSK